MLPAERLKDQSPNGHFFAKAAQAHYGHRAGDYAKRDETKWDNPGLTAVTLEKICQNIKPHDVLELGTGTGRYFPYLLGNKYTGVDICNAMLNQARSRLKILNERGFSETVLIQTDISDFLSNSPQHAFDFIFSIGCVGYHVPLNGPLMGSFFKVLKPGGTLYLQTTQSSLMWKIKKKIRHIRNIFINKTDEYHFLCTASPRLIKKAASKAGFSIEWIREEKAKWFDKPMLLSLLRKTG